MLIATLLVRDEEEIVAQNIEHHLENGVDKFIVTDNGSVDNTRSIIEKYPEVLEIIDEPTYNYNQDVWVTRMAHLACDYGAKYVVHLDADEFWYGLEKTPELLDNFLAFKTGRGCDHIPTYGLKYGNFKRSSMPYYINSMMIMQGSKVVHKASKEVFITQGNHSIKGGFHPMKQEVYIHHYPIRSYEHFEKKVINGGSAYENSDKPERFGFHWREWYKEWKNGNLKDVYESMLMTRREIKERLLNKTLFRDILL